MSAKTITVRIGKNKEEYTFEGIITGREISRVINHMPARYRKHKQNVRRGLVETISEKVPVPPKDMIPVAEHQAMIEVLYETDKK